MGTKEGVSIGRYRRTRFVDHSPKSPPNIKKIVPYRVARQLPKASAVPKAHVPEGPRRACAAAQNALLGDVDFSGQKELS